MKLEHMIDRAIWLHIRHNPALLEDMVKAAKLGVVEMFDVLYPELPDGSTEAMLVDICMLSMDLEGLRSKLRDMEFLRSKMP